MSLPRITKVQCWVCGAVVSAGWNGEVGEGDLIDIMVTGAAHACKPQAESSWAAGFSCWVRTGDACIADGVALREHEPAAGPRKVHENDFRDRCAGVKCGRCGRVAEDFVANGDDAETPWLATRWRTR